MVGSKGSRRWAPAVAAASILAALCLGASVAGANEAEIVYNNLPASPLPGNVVSEAFEATETAEFGGLVELGGTARRNGDVMVGMSSWACQKGSWTGTPECITTPGAKYSWPIYLSIYEVGPGNSVGRLLKRGEYYATMPYRPSQNDYKCLNEHHEPTGAYYYRGQCWHGKYFKLTIPVGMGFTWPSKAIIAISYNTSDYGPEPKRPKPCDSESGGCFYDSLNVGLTEGLQSPTVGSDPTPNNDYQNTKYAPYYCDGGAGGTGTFRLDEGCWEGYQPLFAVKAVH